MRLAKSPNYPEAPLKCPRCESTNTKFCYFNNYSLSQPRHFCKTCRRYWTRGGALRNVPVGGGCRRSSKKSKSSQSQSTSTLSSTTPISPNMPLLVNSNFIGNSTLPIFSSMPNVAELLNAGGNNDLGFQIWKSSASAGTLEFGDQSMTSSLHQLNSNPVSTFAGRYEQAMAGANNFNPLAYDQVGFAHEDENQGLNTCRNFPRINGNDQYWSNANTLRD